MTEQQKLERAIEYLKTIVMFEAENSSCNVEDSATQEDIDNRIWDYEALTYALSILKKKVKK